MSDSFARLLAGQLAPGVYRLASRRSTLRLAARATQANWRCFVLEGHDLADKPQLLAALGQALGAPAYFGHNWDALLDVLRDLAWAPTERGYLLFWDDARRLASSAPQDYGVALDVLRDAVAYWSATGTPLTVLLRGLGRHGDSVPRLQG